ncbi:unnamed protein product [Parajaminaea phylloscopi]
MSFSPFDSATPDAASVDPPTISTADCYAQVNSVWAAYGLLAIAFFEIASSYETEARMYIRVSQRKGLRINVSELFFLLIKYLMAIGAIGKTCNWFMSYPTRPQCQVTAWLEALGFSLAAGVVPFTMSLRAVAVGRASKSARRLWWFFGPLCGVHMAFALIMSFFASKSTYAANGTCVWPTSREFFMFHITAKESPKLWWAVWCLLTDLAIGIFTTRELYAQRGSCGWYEFSRLLFENSIHYMGIMSVANLVQLTSHWYPGWQDTDTPELILVLQCVLAMRLVGSEQDFVNGFKKSTTSNPNAREWSEGGRPRPSYGTPPILRTDRREPTVGGGAGASGTCRSSAIPEPPSPALKHSRWDLSKLEPLPSAHMPYHINSTDETGTLAGNSIMDTAQLTGGDVEVCRH